MNRFIYLCWALLPGMLIAAQPVSAQTIPALEKHPLAPGPVMNRAPSSAKWTITYTYPAVNKSSVTGNGPAPVKMASLTVTKTGDIYHEEQTFSDGTRHESWHVGNQQIMRNSSSGKIGMYDLSGIGRPPGDSNYQTPFYTDYSQTDFPALQWVSPGNYQGVQKIGDAEYLVFQQTASSGGPAGGAEVPTSVARIDVETHLPFQAQGSDALLTYQFETGPSSVQTLPSDIQALLDKRAALIKKLTTRVPSY